MVRTVERVIEADRGTTADGDTIGGEEWISSTAVCRCGRSSRRKRDQIVHVPSVQRQLEHAGVFDDLTHAGVSGLHQCRVGLHFHLFGYLSYFKYRIDNRAGVYLQDDSGL